MSKPIVGTLSGIDAFQQDEYVWLVGTGVNNSTGWKNDFIPNLDPNRSSDWIFVQYEPTGVVIWVMQPFVVKQLIVEEPVPKAVSVRYRDSSGNVVDKLVQVRQSMTPSDHALVKYYLPIELYAGDDPRVSSAQEESQKSSARSLYAFAPKSAVYRRALGSLDNPFDCCGCCRNMLPYCDGSRRTWYLEVTTPDERDIARAVEECLKMAAIAAALAALAAAIGTGGVALGAAIEAFVAVLKPCLVSKLGEAVTVKVDSQYACR